MNGKNLEEIVLDLHATVNNGLTDRTKNTEKMVKELAEQMTTTNNLLHNHLKSDERDHALVIEKLQDVSKQQKKYNAWMISGLVVLNGWLVAGLVWVVQHSKEIGALLEQLTKL